MGRKKSVDPRKRPASRIGASIYDAILDATVRLIDEGGLEAFSTNRVADLAGVSIGSLYQYFPNKDAILVELFRRQEVRSLQLLDEVLERHKDDPLRVLASAIVEILTGPQLGSVRVRRALRYSLPEKWAGDTARGVDATLRENGARLLAARRDVRSADPALLVFVVGHAIELVTETAILHQPQLVRQDVFREELVELMVRYLQKTEVPATDEASEHEP